MHTEHSTIAPLRAIPRRAETAATIAPANPLETIARSDSASSLDLLWQGRLKERFELQDGARQILCKGQTEEGKMPFRRLFGCERLPHGSKEGAEPRIKGYYVLRTGRSYRTGLQHCGSKAVCAPCSGRDYDLAKVEIAAALEQHRAAGKKALMISLTGSHHHPALADFKTAFKAALRGLYGGRAFEEFKARFGFIGCITAVEVTWSPENGWHFHVHILWFLDELQPADVRQIRRYVDERWRAQLRRHGLSGSRRRATDVKDSSFTADDYLAKFEHARRWDADAELTMNQRKHGKRRGLSVWDLLRVAGGTLENAPISAEKAEALFREYGHATAGDHMLYWSPGLREHFALLAAAADDEPAGDDPDEHEAEVDETEGQADGVLISDLAPDAWRVVVGNAARAELAIVEASGDPAAVKAFLEALGVRCMLLGAVVMADGT